jgi:hypothetical protein
MAILSLVAITLLSSAHAIDIPAARDAIREVQSRYFPRKAQVLGSLKDLAAPVQHMARTGPTLQSQQSPLQDFEACAAASMLPCTQGLGVISEAMNSNNASGSVAYFEGFCTNCTDPAGDFLEFTTACNITGQELQAIQSLGQVLDNACDDPTCAGNTLWAFGDLEDRLDTFCPNLECGLPIVEPLVSALAGNATGSNCISSLFSLTCLTDDEDDTVYCQQLFTENMNSDSLEDFCGSSCAESLTVVFEALADGECGVEVPMAECDNEDFEPFRLIDFCTENDNDEYCFELLTNDETNLTACGDVFGMVPAPDADGIDTPDECPAQCAAELQSYADSLGCCAGFGLEIQCTDPGLVSFITDVCGVSYTTCDRPVISTDANSPEGASDASSLGIMTFVSALTVALTMLM